MIDEDRRRVDDVDRSVDVVQIGSARIKTNLFSLVHKVDHRRAKEILCGIER